MSVQEDTILRLVGDLADPGGRKQAADALARHLGGESLHLFAPDPELGTLLPAPGFAQTLRAAGEWRRFIDQCVATGVHVGTLTSSEGEPTHAVGSAEGRNLVAILLGGYPRPETLDRLSPSFPLLAALFRSERELAAAEVKVRIATESAERAGVLTRALQELRAKLMETLQEVQEAREHARQRAELAEELTEELRAQTTHLEDQARELEELNDSLATSDARLRATIDSSLDAIVTMDRAGGIIGWNRRAEEVFGWTAEEATGLTVENTIIPPRYRDAHRAGLERYIQTGEGPILNRRIEIEALRRDGAALPVELTISVAGTGTHLLFSAFIRDLSEQKQLERRRAAEQSTSRALASAMSLDELAASVLPAIGVEMGWKRGAFWILDTRSASLRCVKEWEATSSEGSPRGHELPECRRGEGLAGRVWESGEPIWEDAGAGRDDRGADGSAAAVGEAAAFGFPIRSGNEVLGVLEFSGSGVIAPDAALLHTAHAIGSDIGQGVLRLVAERERDRLVTELKRINRRLAKVNADLATRSEEAERARAAADAASHAKSEFLANMSHELRTPINAIIGYGQLLEMEITGPITPDQRAQLERIRSSSKHLLTLINDILDLAKVESGHLVIEHERAPMAPVIREALALVSPQAAEGGITIDDRCTDESLHYVGDRDRVRQILVNLLSNAVKFTPQGGLITLRCGTSDRQEPGARLLGSGPWTCVEIEDTGVGISAEEMPVIFQPFVQAETGRTRTRGGTGLGLTISRQLARLMGGDLTAKSQVGQGSCFTLWIPETESVVGALDETIRVE